MRAGLLRQSAIGLLTLGMLTSTLCAEMRTWTDSSGKHKVEAELVSYKNGKLTLKRPNGKTAQFPLTRFSKADQTYARKWFASNSPQPIGQTKNLAQRFFNLLVDEKYDEIKPMMSKAAQANWEAVKAQLEGIELPENARAIYVRNFTSEDDLALVNVNFKISGSFKRTKLQFSSDEGPWRVVGFIPDTEQEDSLIAFGAGDTDTALASRDRDEDEDDEDYDDEDRDRERDADLASTDEDEDFEEEDEDDEDAMFRVPDGDAKALIAFINKLKTTRPPKFNNRNDFVTYQRKALTAIYTAADMAMEQDPDKATLKVAATNKIETLSVLTQLSPDSKYQDELQGLPQKLKSLGLDDLAKTAQAIKLKVDLSSAKSLASATKAIEAIAKHFQNVKVDSLTSTDFSVIQSATSLSARVSPELGAKVNKMFGEMLTSSARLRPLGEQMLATARRLGLVGNPIELTGVTTTADSFSIDEFKGKVVLVDFWATWCGPCMAEMPNIRKNYEKYHDLGFEVVAVSVDRNLDALKQYLDKETPPWTVLIDEHPDNPTKMGDFYGISAIPTTVLVDRDGTVITFDCRGRKLGQQLEKLFDEAT